MKYANPAHQNFNAWARRMKLSVDTDTCCRELDAHFPGSVLVGPLSLCFAIYLKGQISNKQHRRAAAMGAAKTLAAILRGEAGNGNVLAGLEEHTPPDTMARYWPILDDVIDKAMAARTAEKSRPSLANIILGKVKVW